MLDTFSPETRAAASGLVETVRKPYPGCAFCSAGGATGLATSAFDTIAVASAAGAEAGSAMAWALPVTTVLGAATAAASTLPASAAADCSSPGAAGAAARALARALDGSADASICSVPSAGAAGATTSGAEVLSHCFSPHSSQALQPLSLISLRD